MPQLHLSPHGAPRYASGVRVAASVATMTALAAFLDGSPERVHGNVIDVDADGSRWRWHESSTLTSDGILVQSASDVATVTAGRWLRCVGYVNLGLPFTFATADGATLLTIPTGCIFKLESAHWKITTACAGGSSSAIGAAATGHATAGDILGGAAGDVEATLTAGTKAGTIGAKMDTDSELHSMIFVATAVFTFERITSVFTSGAGNVQLVGSLLAHAGA